MALAHLAPNQPDPTQEFLFDGLSSDLRDKQEPPKKLVLNTLNPSNSYNGTTQFGDLEGLDTTTISFDENKRSGRDAVSATQNDPSHRSKVSPRAGAARIV